MKKTIILFLLLALQNVLFSQNQDEVLLGQGNALYEMIMYEMGIDDELESLDTTHTEGKIRFEVLFQQRERILNKSLEYYEKLIKEFPKSNLYLPAINNAALVSHQLGYEEKAIKYFQAMLKMDRDDQLENGNEIEILSETQANIKNRACKNLAEIHINKGEYEQAITYLELTKEYPFSHFCGNEYAEDDIYVATLYTKAYQGLGKVDSALQYALPHMFSNGLADNIDIVMLIIDILKENYDLKQVKEDFEKSYSNYYSETKRNTKVEWKNYYMTFFDCTIPLPFYELEFSENTDMTIKENVEKSYFYKWLTK